MSCTDASSVNSKIETPTELKIFEEHFYSIYGSSPFLGSITFSDKTSKYIGICHRYPWNFMFLNRIVINTDYWKYASQYQKEELIFHELAHCIYYLNHDTSFNRKLNCPNSIMNSYALGDCYVKNRDYYIKELKTKISKEN